MVKVPGDVPLSIGATSIKADGDVCGGVVSLACVTIGKLTKPTGTGEKIEVSELPYFECTVLCTSGTGDASSSTE